jgi:hypothetical protein
MLAGLRVARILISLAVLVLCLAAWQWRLPIGAVWFSTVSKVSAWRAALPKRPAETVPRLPEMVDYGVVPSQRLPEKSSDVAAIVKEQPNGSGTQPGPETARPAPSDPTPSRPGAAIRRSPSKTVKAAPKAMKSSSRPQGVNQPNIVPESRKPKAAAPTSESQALYTFYVVRDTTTDSCDMVAASLRQRGLDPVIDRNVTVVALPPPTLADRARSAAT